MALNRRGFFFTILVLVVVSILTLSSIFYTQVNERKDIQKRVQTMNSFLTFTEEDMRRNLYIAGFRTIFLIEKRIAEKGAYASNVPDAFNESFFNGSLYGENQTLLADSTFNAILGKLQDRAKNINVNINLTSPSINVSQDDPWQIKITLTAQLLMNDANNLASWNTTLISSAFIPIQNFEDPLYTINSQGRVTRMFLKTPYNIFAQGSNVNNLTDHLNKRYYRASDTAPNFLHRLEGSAAADVQGVESLVYLPDLSTQGIPVESKSVVDYIYFSTSNPTSHLIQGMPSWFQLDDAHLAPYNVTGLAL